MLTESINKKKERTVNFRVEDSVKDILKERAKKEKVSQSVIARRIFDIGLSKDNNEKQ